MTHSAFSRMIATQYGHLPPTRMVDAASDLLPPTATRRLIRLTVGAWHGDLLWHHPTGPGPHPVVIALNFNGNHTTSAATDIPEATYPVTEARPRGADALRWPFELALGMGVGVATLCASQALTDHADSAVQDAHPGIRALTGPAHWSARAPEQFGAIAAWAWTLSLIRGWLATQPRVDAARLACFGHSRLGKASLLAGSTDPGFALVGAMGSGTCGQSPSRKTTPDAETTERIQRVFPHWFSPSFAAIAAHPEALPFDQHDLLERIAPRTLVLIDGSDDRWADPLGAQTLAQRITPQWGTAIPPLHILRSGGHAITATDWAVLLTQLR